MCKMGKRVAQSFLVLLMPKFELEASNMVYHDARDGHTV